MSLLAQAKPWEGLEQSDPNAVADVATIGSISSILTNIISAIVVFSGIVLFVMLVVGGMNFLLSGGDQKKLDKAKGTVSNALLGLVFLVVSYLVLKLIQAFTGVDVTTFGFTP